MNNIDKTRREQRVGGTNKKAIVFTVLFVGVLLIFISSLLILLPQKESDTNEVKKKHYPNIVLIVLDAFRADRIGAERNGIPLTPFLNQLTHEAVYFTNAITPCTWTRPAMTSVFTSLHVDAHQVYYGISPVEEDLPFSDVLPKELRTIATYFKEVGFTTLAVQTNGQLSEDFGFHRGFDSYVYLKSPPGEEATAKAITLSKDVNNPFFLYVHYMDPHTPYNPPQEYLDLVGYSVDALAPEEGKIVEDFYSYFWDHANFITGRSTKREFNVLSPEAQDALIARYDAEVRYCDEQVKRLISSIKKQHPKTIFVITADHGEHLWDHNYLGHGLTMYDCELRIPLFIMADRLAPSVIEKPVSLVGVLPTLTVLLGIETQNEWQGRNYFETDADDNPVFSYTRSPSPSWNTDVEAVIFQGMKYIRDNKKETEELYTWLEDPQEKNNLATQKPEIAARMLQMLLKHKQDNIKARRSVRQQTNIDAETIEQLRNLGYMQ